MAGSVNVQSGYAWLFARLGNMLDDPVSLFPVWPVSARIGACVSTRLGGVSQPPFDQLNLGDHVGDRPDDVAVNRKRWAAGLGVDPVWMRQVHGIHAQVLTKARQADLHGVEADAALTTESGLACVVGVADCLPILLAVLDEGSEGRTQQQGVAAIHAGWRGLAHGVIENTVQALCCETATSPKHIVAWLGPCIGPTRFEVGAEVYASLKGHGAAQARFVPASTPDKWFADLAGLARDRLHALGLASVHGNDSHATWCTALQSERYFSHRRDEGRTGRMAAAIWIKP
ncbi:MAG: peptidoglycan editing factor PgeF [Leptothrix ochracea]|uniref:peptidoglycan editing factor PgeF n=2 Tax=Leptothrix ochracea TaxID=735331 RepID=UPI0034E22D48